MMDGVHTLNTIPHTVYGWGYDSTGMGLVIVGIAIILLCIGFAIYHRDFMLSVFSLLSIFMFVPALICFSLGEVTGTYNTYEVYIDRGVDMVEFMERYEIVEQRNDLFVIKDRIVQE